MNRDGKMCDAGIDAEVKHYSEPPSERMLPREKKSDIYPVQKAVKGFAIKCMDIPGSTRDLITELCVAHLQPATLTDAQGEPLVASPRVTIVQKMLRSAGRTGDDASGQTGGQGRV
jgi:hypothetical protein